MNKLTGQNPFQQTRESFTNTSNTLHSKSKSQVKRQPLRQENSNLQGTKSDVFTPLREKSPEQVREIVKKFQLPEEVKSRAHSRGLSSVDKPIESVKTSHRPKSQERARPNYEPMQPLPESYKAPSKLHEQVVATMRRERETMAEAYSNEKGTRMQLQDALYEKDFRISQQDREIKEVRLQNERLVEAERFSIRQIEDLKARN